ncbi:ParB/RepB/Spo0J family partition protein [Halobacteriaceae bacterium SHR40]|uniref:ParB/RepB/Spo0J family partition protein n=1 Tax=Halovenus amylolytica TaxID=2500550 RepID=UPI000FE38D0D
MVATQPDPALLPNHYDQLIPIERLEHGVHNPRRVSPRPELEASIKQAGIQQPLIVRPADERAVYFITDGWQRFQAATSLGWEQLPVSVYDSPLEALSATEAASIVREWSSYEWAQYCQSLASELRDDDDSRRAVADCVATRTTRSPQTVRRYLDGLSLPSVVHPLLCDGPDGDEQAWQALQNYNPDVRQYTGLSWRVAARLGRRLRAESVSIGRTVGTAANAVEYDTSDALSFVDRAMDEPDVPFRTIHRRIQQAAQYSEYLQVPSVTVALEQSEREAVMAYCAEQRQPLSALVEEQIKELAAEVGDG